jgi:hypothetical protein
VAAAIVSYLIARVLPRWLTSSFVDVVRYLDTSPRPYAVRRDIRKGLVEMLQALHASKAPRYDRIVLVAHSLGTYLAYDAVAYLWGLTNAQTAHDGKDVPIPSGLKELEQAASALPALEDWQSLAVHNHVDEYQAAPRQLWKGIRAQGNPWLITDFVSVGTPMYFADQLLHGKRGRSFGARIERRERPTCPPHNEENPENNINGTRWYYSWEKTTWEQEGGQRRRVSRRILYEGAPFAVVRWTNVYFPAEAGFFGDWFGGPLARLFGPGIRDVKVRGNTLGKPSTTWLRHRRMPGIAHSYNFYFPDDSLPESVTTTIRDGMDLASSKWLQNSPTPDPESHPRALPETPPRSEPRTLARSVPHDPSGEARDSSTPTSYYSRRTCLERGRFPLTSCRGWRGRYRFGDGQDRASPHVPSLSRRCPDMPCVRPLRGVTVPVDTGLRWDWTPICRAGSDVDVDVDGGVV